MPILHGNKRRGTPKIVGENYVIRKKSGTELTMLANFQQQRLPKRKTIYQQNNDLTSIHRRMFQISLSV